MGGMDSLLERAKEMQERNHRERSATTATGNAGEGLVTATMNGHRQLQSIEIAPEALAGDDLERLQGWVLQAVNDALDNIDEDLAKRYGPSSGLPDLSSLL